MTSQGGVRCPCREVATLQRFFVPSTLAALISEMERVAPSEASLIAVARPMPLPAPVMSMILSVKSGILC